MLRGTRENSSFLALISNSAGVAMLCFLLLASTVVAVIPQPNLHSTMLSSAYAQEAEDTEAEDTEAEDTEAEDTEGGEISDEEQEPSEEDTTAPTVTETEPADGATDVAANTTISA